MAVIARAIFSRMFMASAPASFNRSSALSAAAAQVIMCFSGLSAYQDTKQTGHTFMVVLIVRFLSVVCGPSREDTRKEGQKHSKDYAGCSVLVNDGS
jgi:hypothetical protein